MLLLTKNKDMPEIQQTQDFFGNYRERYPNEDEESVEEGDDQASYDTTTVEELRTSIEEITATAEVPAGLLQSLDEVLDTVEIWRGRSVSGKDWQRIINRIGQEVVKPMETGRFSEAEKNLDSIQEEIHDIEAEA